MRLVLRKLWSEQDDDQASMGRTVRNKVLEAAMNLLPLNSIARHIELDQLPFEKVLAEAKRHHAIHVPRREESYKKCPPLQKLSDLELSGLLLRILKSIYRKEKRKDLRDRLRNERELLEIALALFPRQGALPKPLPWKTEDVLKEADERRFHAFRR